MVGNALADKPTAGCSGAGGWAVGRASTLIRK